jgi:hypothetical protein
LDFHTEFICRAGLPVWSPMDGIQADVRCIQQLGKSSTQCCLPPHETGMGCRSNRQSLTHNTSSYLSGTCIIIRSNRREGAVFIRLGSLFVHMGSWQQRTAVAHDQYPVPPGPITDQRFRAGSGRRGSLRYV